MQRIPIHIEEDLLEELDDVAEAEYANNRSAAAREAIRQFLELPEA